MINLLKNDKEIWEIVQTIHCQDTFLFTYDIHKSINLKKDFLDSDHDVDDFKVRARIAMEFSLILRNFKAFKKIESIKANFFYLLGVYLIDKPSQSMIFMPKKQ